MCLNVDQTFKTQTAAERAKALTAKKDIIVYKRFKNNPGYWSPYQGFPYQKGKVYSVPGFSRSTGGFVGSGYTLRIRIGFHAYISRGAARANANAFEKVVQCVIPKGARYFLGTCKEIVSTKLIIGQLKK